MDQIYDLGIDLIRFIQQLQTPFLNRIFKVITDLGSETFYILLFPFILWSIDFKKGSKLGTIFLLSVYLNELLKVILHQPRPFDLVPGINIIPEHGFGIPSGHTQSALLIWGIISTWTKSKPLKALFYSLIFLIAFSRIYLGVHFPTDILGGLIAGTIMLILYFKYMDLTADWFDGLILRRQLFLIPIAPIILTIVYPVKNCVNILGILTGLGVGLALFHTYFRMEFKQDRLSRALRFLIGIIIVFPIYFGNQYIRPPETSIMFIPVYFLTKAFIGLLITFIVPWLFLKFKLATETQRAY